MARPPRGQEMLFVAQQRLSKTDDATELRILQAVVFPLEYGMTTQETALAIGRSPRWVSMARNEYIRHAGVSPGKAQTIRNHAHMPLAEEKEFLVPFFEKACCGGILVVNEVYRALEEHLGCEVALSSAYNLLHRHGWRKLAPDKRNIEADAPVQEDWKKNCLSELPKLKKRGNVLDQSGSCFKMKRALAV